MTSFKDIQESFQRAVLEGDTSILSDIRKSDKESRKVLLGVYQNAYVLRLIEFLDNEYEKLNLILGDDQYDVMARAYIENTISHSPNARDYGRKLPEFLRDHAPFCEIAILGDMADFERALNNAFDAGDAPALTLEHMGAIAPEDWPQQVFTPHPSVTKLDLKTNAQAVWQALEAEEDPPEIISPDEPDRIIVFREDMRSMFRSMNYEEAMLWDQLVKGLNFGELCELSATYGGEDEASLRVAGYLKGWMTSEMLKV